jgi:hypothetical protein
MRQEGQAGSGVSIRDQSSASSLLSLISKSSKSDNSHSQKDDVGLMRWRLGSREKANPISLLTLTLTQSLEQCPPPLLSTELYPLYPLLLIPSSTLQFIVIPYPWQAQELYPSSLSLSFVQ